MQLADLLPFRKSHNGFKDNRLLWQRVLIIAAVLLISILVASSLSLRLSLVLMALPFALVGAVVLLRWPPLGLVFMVAASLALPVEIIYVIGTTAVIAFGLTALWLFDQLFVKRTFTWIKTRTILPLIFYFIITILAFINGQLPWYPITQAPLDGQLGGILILLVAICGYVLVMYQIKSERWLMAMVYVTIGVGALLIFGRIFPPTSRLVGRIFPPMVPSGSMFWTWISVLAFSQAIFNKALHSRWRALLLSVTLGALFIALGPARAWVSGWFPPIIGLGVILWLGATRQAVAATLLGGVIILTQLQSLLNNLLFIGDNEYSQTTRLEAWRIIGEIVKVSPLLGLGPANYSYYTPLYPILGWYVQFNSHNQYVDIVAQTGILGLLCIIWFAWEITRLAWRLKSMVPKGGFLQAYVYGTFGGIVATFAAGMLGDWLLPYVYNATIRAMRTSILPWLFMGGLVAVEQILLARQAKQ